MLFWTLLIAVTPYDAALARARAFALARPFYCFLAEVGTCGALRYVRTSDGFGGRTDYFDERGAQVDEEWHDDTGHQKTAAVACVHKLTRDLCAEARKARKSVGGSIGVFFMGPAYYLYLNGQPAKSPMHIGLGEGELRVADNCTFKFNAAADPNLSTLKVVACPALGPAEVPLGSHPRYVVRDAQGAEITSFTIRYVPK